LKLRVNELGLTDRVTFRGWGKPADVASFLSGLDAMILLTRTTNAVREQFGRVIVESQACGVPVIGSTGGAIPDVVGKGGWTIPERDPDALAILLDRLAAEPQQLLDRGAAARDNVLTRFTYEVVANALVSACQQAADAKQGADRRRP
jgi:glycosyltransferase involved in cell wall biosynthesis